MCRRVVADALSPDLALAYLRELQPDLADVAVGPAGVPLPGADGALRARSGNLEIAAIPGPTALATLLAYDVERVAEVLNA